MYHRLQRAMTSVWQGNIVYDESVMFVPHPKTSEISPAPLLYAPDEIVSVCSADFMVEYRENSDYILSNGCLQRLAGGRMPFMERDQYFLKEPADISIESVSFPGRYVRYDPDGVEFARHQVVVTYRHSGSWKGPIVRCQPQILPRTLDRLRDRQPLKLLFYGDSVMEGCDATGRSGVAPYLPPSDDLVTVWLAQQYKHPSIRKINTAVGGMDSAWGRDSAAERVARHTPDLVVVCFGMNDGSRKIPVADFARNIMTILETAREQKPEAEFLLISPGLPNPDCKGWTSLQAEYAPALEHIAAAVPGCCHVPITAIHQYLYSKKRYDDMNGNGVNHPNDFLARVNAQAMAACLLES